MVVVWFDVLLLVLGLVLPPLYVVVLGRMYVKRCEILFQLIRNYGCDCSCRVKR